MPRRRGAARGPAGGLLVPLACAAVIAAAASGLVLGRLTAVEAEVHTPPLVTTAVHGHLGAMCIASWYDTGEITATGVPYDDSQMTAASKTIPFDARVVVTELIGGRSVVVRINDRGPYIDGRCIDLTPAAFSVIAPVEVGIVPVRVEVVEIPVRYEEIIVSE